MNKIKVVDSRMGRGKTSAAIQYMKSSPGKRFIYVTPYLNEVDKICHLCDFEQPESPVRSKLETLKGMMRKNKNVATTHSLLLLADQDIMDLARERHYNIIIDESIEVLQKIMMSEVDTKVVTSFFADVDKDDRRVVWKNRNYVGRFSDLKEHADCGVLYELNGTMFVLMNPEILRSFDEVIMMTYMFCGNIQKAYLEYFGFEYEICGIDTSDGFRFTDTPDEAPAMDYASLIHIIDDRRLNKIGEDRCALSYSWFLAHGKKSDELKRLRCNLDHVYRRYNGVIPVSRQLWTVFKIAKDNLLGQRGRYGSSFLQMNAKATNNYRDRDVVCYLVNRFIDPSYKMFFGAKGICIDESKYALSEMLQFIWRSAIRDGKPITVYIPSKRMRDLLKAWISENSTRITGGEKEVTA